MSLIASHTMTIKSPEISDNGYIPEKYTCDGSNINPEIHIHDIPPQAKTLVLIMDDTDAPNGVFDHWLMWDIPVKEKIAENSAPGTQGPNGHGENKYFGPKPPSGTHHYHFKIYALDCELKLPEDTDKKTLLHAMDGHIVAHGELTGLYKHKNQNS